MATDDILHLPEHDPACDPRRWTSVVTAIRSYLHDVAEDFRARHLPPADPRGEDPQTIADAVFDLLTRREFTYLSKARSRAYRAAIVAGLIRDATAGRPLCFFYDIGGGYRAGVDDRRRALSFSPGLGELLALRQITRLDRQVRALYPPGARFCLVVDNICARLVNDIPLHRTAAYCAELRGLIRRLQLEARIDLLVESEHFSPEDYSVDTRGTPAEVPSRAAVENVARFLGRECDVSEAAERIARYRVVSGETERRLQSRVHGVRMTQRATASTFGFRCFPGSDSRLQSGDVVLAYRDRDRIEPRLVTSQSPWAAGIRWLDVPDLLPLPGKQVGFVIADRVGSR
jgi:pyoverdine/dityrosine biosynthesis protein